MHKKASLLDGLALVRGNERVNREKLGLLVAKVVGDQGTRERLTDILE